MGGVTGLTDLLRSRPAGGVAAAAGWTRRSTTDLEVLYPTLANARALSAGAAAWAFGAYSQCSAAVAADYYPHGVHLSIQASPNLTVATPVFVEVEVATGAAGAEVPYGTVCLVFTTSLFVADSAPFLNFGLTLPLGPTLVPSGTRLAARCRQSQTQANVGTTVRIYVTGHHTPVPASDATYGLDSYLGGSYAAGSIVTPAGATLAVPTLAYPNYGAWTQVIASAARDSLVRGVSYDQGAAATNLGRHMQFGIGAAGAEVPYSLIGLPAGSTTGCGIQLLRRPLLLLAGERLAVRQSGGGLTNNHQFLYEDL